MRILLAVLCTALFGTPAPAAAAPLLTHGTLDGAPAAYLGCVRLDADATSYCFVAVHEGGATSVTSVVRPPGGPATVTRVTRDAAALRTGVAGIRSTVRLDTTLPGIGDVDLTSYSGAATGSYVVNDTCTPAPVQMQLWSAHPVLGFVAWTDGTVGGAPAENLDGCASALAVGPVSGTWRTASGL